MTFIPATAIGTGVVITLLISYQLTKKLVLNSGLYKKWMEKKEEKKEHSGVAIAADDMQQVDGKEKVDKQENEEEIVNDKGTDDQMNSKVNPPKEEKKDDGKNEATNVSPDLLTLERGNGFGRK